MTETTIRPQDLSSASEIVEEVSSVLEQLCLKHPGVFDALQVRYPLADELSGFAAMLRNFLPQAQAQQERMAALENLLEIQTTWIEGSLSCKSHDWDGDQRAAALRSCTEARDLLLSVSQPLTEENNKPKGASRIRM